MQKAARFRRRIAIFGFGRERGPGDSGCEAVYIAQSIDRDSICVAACACKSWGAYMQLSRRVISRLFARIKPVGPAARVAGNSTRRMPSRRVFKAMGHQPRAGNGNPMKTRHQNTPIGGMRRFGSLFIRLAVGLLLGSAIAVAVVAAGLDLLPLWP